MGKKKQSTYSIPYGELDQILKIMLLATLFPQSMPASVSTVKACFLCGRCYSKYFVRGNHFLAYGVQLAPSSRILPDLVGLIVYRSCASNDSCSEFLSTTAMPCLEDCIPPHPLIFWLPFSSMLPEPRGSGIDRDVSHLELSTPEMFVLSTLTSYGH